PLGFQPAGPDTQSQPSAGQDIDGCGRTRRHEGVPEADVVDVGSEPDSLGSGGQVAEDGEGVEDRDVRRNGWMVRTLVRTTGGAERNDKVLRHPDRLKAQAIRHHRYVCPQARTDRAEM